MKHNNGIVSHLIVTNTSFLEEIKTRKHVFTHLSQFKGFWISLWKIKGGQGGFFNAYIYQRRRNLCECLINGVSINANFSNSR